MDQIHIHKRQNIMPLQLFAFTYVCILNTLKTRCPCTPCYCATPTNVATSSSTALWQKKNSHELAISFDNHQASCSYMQWVVQLASTLYQWQNHSHPCVSQRACQKLCTKGTTLLCERRAESGVRRASIWRAESIEELKIAKLTHQI